MKYSRLSYLFTAWIIWLLSAGLQAEPITIRQHIAALPDSSSGTLLKPVTINIYAGRQNNGKGSGRIYVNSTMIGNLPVTIPLLFDTGSAGVTLDALKIFPASIVDRKGFKFKPGQDTINYRGIVITKNVVQKVYGLAGAVKTQEFGNIGFTTLTIGDASGALTIKRMPVLFFYEKLANGQEKQNGLGSMFGVNTAINSVQGVPYSSMVFNLVSPFKYINYKNGLTAGYKLDAIDLNGCAINLPGNCPAQPLLTVGLTADDFKQYKFSPLKYQSPGNSIKRPLGFPAYPQLPLYYAAVPASKIGTAYQEQTAYVLLDSGNPTVILNTTKENLDADHNPVITLTLPSGNRYIYNQFRAPFATRFNPTSNRSVYGVYFFTAFNFLEDYENGRIGLKVR